MKNHLLSLAPIELLYPSEIYTYSHTGLSNPIFLICFKSTLFQKSNKKGLKHLILEMQHEFIFQDKGWGCSDVARISTSCYTIQPCQYHSIYAKINIYCIINYYIDKMILYTPSLVKII